MKIVCEMTAFISAPRQSVTHSLEMLHLAGTQKLQSRHVGRFRIPVQIDHMIAAAAGRRHFAFRAAFELPVGQNRKAHAAIDERTRINA